MSEEKLWRVTVSVDIEMYVAAPTREEAIDVADEDWREEFENDNADVHMSAQEITDQTAVPSECLGSLPWGMANDHPRRDWTIRQWLAARTTETGQPPASPG